MLQEQDAERSANAAPAFSQDWLLAIPALAKRQLEVSNTSDLCWKDAARCVLMTAGEQYAASLTCARHGPAEAESAQAPT